MLCSVSELMDAAEVFGVVCLVPDCWRCVLSHRNSASAPHYAVCVCLTLGTVLCMMCCLCFCGKSVCVCVCVSFCPFKTHADQPQLQPSMTHLQPQPVATGGHPLCDF